MRRLIHGRKYDTDAPLLLDIYPGANYAFSVRKLSKHYTGPCLEVRRSSDNATLDIGFVDGEIDMTSLLSFIGSGSGFVRTWYNQTVNSKHLINTDNASQPSIVIASTGYLLNGKPRIHFNTQCLRMLDTPNEMAGTFESLVGRVLSTFMVFSPITNGGALFGITDSSGWWYHLHSSTLPELRTRHNAGQQPSFPASFPLNQQNLVSTVRPDNFNLFLYKNTTSFGSQPLDGSWSNSALVIGRPPATTRYKSNYQVQEFISYPINQTHVLDINQEIVTYYGIS